MKKVLFVDFDDSFTHNVIQELKRFPVEVIVVKWNELFHAGQSELLVLGPGPGTPSDYQVLFPFIREWIQNKKKIFGVCLGHQIFWELRGQRVERSKLPLHGQSIEFSLTADWKSFLNLPDKIRVQRYNSLCVRAGMADIPGEMLYLHENEIVMSKGANHITYQFHPESVGTICRRAFFDVVSAHLL